MGFGVRYGCGVWIGFGLCGLVVAGLFGWFFLVWFGWFMSVLRVYCWHGCLADPS